MAAMERGGSGGATASMSRDQCVDVLACLSPASRSCQLGAGRSPGPDGAGAKGGRGEGRRRRLQRVLEPPWAAASRAGSSIRLLETGDGDSPAPASSVGGRAARDLREAGAREAEAEMLAGGCGGHQTCRGRPVGVPEGPVPNGAIFHSSLMIRPPRRPASPLPLPSPLPPPHTHFSLPPPRPPLPLPFPHALPLMPYSRLKHDEGTD